MNPTSWNKASKIWEVHPSRRNSSDQKKEWQSKGWEVQLWTAKEVKASHMVLG